MKAHFTYSSIRGSLVSLFSMVTKHTETDHVSVSQLGDHNFAWATFFCKGDTLTNRFHTTSTLEQNIRGILKRISMCANQIAPCPPESSRRGIPENAISSVQFTISKVWVILK